MFRHRRLPGFSMIELLVVMFLIAFMVAFLTIVFVNSTRAAKVKAAQALLQKLEVAIGEYYSAFNEYPPDSGYGLDPAKGTTGTQTQYDAGTLYRYLGKQLTWMKPTQSGSTIDMGHFGPFIQHFQDKELVQYSDPVWGESFMVVDPWLTPIGYIGSRGRVMHKRDSVDLFSAGPDQKTADEKIFDKKNSTWVDSDTPGMDHGLPPIVTQKSNVSYDGSATNANALGLGPAVLNGCLTRTKKDKKINDNNKKNNETLDDINNWDPEN